MARPTDFTPALGKEICARLAAGASLRDIARCCDMPSISTISAWIVENRGNFYDDYMRARQQRAHVVADELLELIQGLTKDIPSGQNAMPHVLARKYQLDHLRWFLAKVLRHEYGDRYEVIQQTSRAEIHLYLPGKPGMMNHEHVIEGQPRQLLEDQSDD